MSNIAGAIHLAYYYSAVPESPSTRTSVNGRMANGTGKAPLPTPSGRIEEGVWLYDVLLFYAQKISPQKAPTVIADDGEAEPERILGALKPYKDECREIGFEEGTEKFGECVLELSR